MRKETERLVQRMESIFSGEPWFGRSVLDILREIKPANASKTPPGDGHSLNEILYHMITWADFTLKRLEKNKNHDAAITEAEDWRQLNSRIHTWKKGISDLENIHQKIIAILKTKKDSFLDEKVDFRNYNFRFLLNGFAEHNIYHLGQLAYIAKYLV